MSEAQKKEVEEEATIISETDKNSIKQCIKEIDVVLSTLEGLDGDMVDEVGEIEDAKGNLESARDLLKDASGTDEPA